jgi:hypothetical protein
MIYDMSYDLIYATFFSGYLLVSERGVFFEQAIFDGGSRWLRYWLGIYPLLSFL